MKAREAEAAIARRLIDEDVAEFMAGLKVRDAVPMIRELRGQGEAARDAALAEARRMLAAGHPPEQVLEQLAATLTNRLLHAPSAALRIRPSISFTLSPSESRSQYCPLA